jgi:eukaryotic-like serine/threonine-protein kinase
VARENLIGVSVAGYTIDREVGEGGTSSVYDAHHPQHGRIALKVLRERLRQDPTAVARFVREAQLGKRVEHPNVVRTIETGVASGVPGVTGDLPFLAIEWADGEILEKYVKRHGALPSEDVATVIMQIAAAVEAAHGENIVHRDLKPENVIYDPETRRAKLLDFGIAAEMTTPAEERLTRAGFFVGTLMYVSPESLSGELVTPAADQYSLATISYFLLTGTLPYSGKQPREMFTQLLTMPPIPLNSAKEELHFRPEVEAVVMRGLAKQPAERYPTVLEFAVELERTLALPAEAPGVIDKFLRRFSRKPDRKR